jgi:hypothetical protein
LLRLFRYCGSSWRDSATALRQELIELAEQWRALGLPGECPYRPTPEELEKHQGLYRDLEEATDIKLTLVQALKSDADGCVPKELYGLAVQMCEKIYEDYLDTARREPEFGVTEEKARQFWPFDVPLKAVK